MWLALTDVTLGMPRSLAAIVIGCMIYLSHCLVIGYP
jgi:hypothetical protein